VGVDSRDDDSPELDLEDPDEPASADLDSRDDDPPEPDPDEPASAEDDSPDLDSPPFAWPVAAFRVGAPVDRRSILAQPLPLKTIVGGANARLTGPAQSGHWWGPASFRPRNTSKRWPQEPQT